MGKQMSGLVVAAVAIAGCSGAPDHVDSSVGIKPDCPARLANQLDMKQAASPKGTPVEAFQLVGRWKGELVLPKKKGKPSPEDELAEAMAKAFLSDLWIEFKEDGTFKMNMMVPIEGKYQARRDLVHLVPESIMGISKHDLNKMDGNEGKVSWSDEPLILEISKDGKTLRVKDENGAQGELVFTRA